MKYAFFQGCNIPIRIQQYARATEAVFNQFGISFETVDDFNCCGYPVRNVDEQAYILPSVRNLAIAEKLGLDIIVICNCCFASLKKAQKVMAEDPQLKAELNTTLAKEGLVYRDGVAIKHFLAALYEDVGVDAIKAELAYKITDLNISVIHGCHILRPREVTQFDDSFVPKITEELLNTTGVTSLDWQGKMECCGAALAGINNDLSQMLLKEKIDGARSAGANYITPVCAYCHLQFDTAQQNIANSSQEETLPVLLYPQLLGLCLGIDAKTLGIEENSTINPQDIEHLQSLLGPPVDEKKKRRRKKTVSA